MHIVVLPSWYPEAPGEIHGSFFREQALALSKYGHQVGVLSPNLRSLRAWRELLTGKRGIKQEIDADVATFRSFGTTWIPRPPKAKAWLWRLHGRRLFQRYVAEYGLPDLIHVYSMINVGVVAQEIKDQYGIPYVITEHFSGYTRSSMQPGHLKIAQSVSAGAASRMGVSPWLSQQLHEKLGVTSGPWTDIPNVVAQCFLDRPLKNRAVSDGWFRFVYVGRLTEDKGVYDLLRAFAKQFRNDNQVTLDIGGDGADRKRLEDMTEHLGVKNQVRFLGALDRNEVVEVMAAADAFVLASHYETFSVVVIEALALGKPVVATRCGGPESIIREQDGLLVPTGDVDRLAGAMQQLREKRFRYGAEELRSSCASRYSESVIVEQLTSIYQQALNN